MAGNDAPKHWQRRLTDEQAVMIRKSYAYGWASANMLARKHGVTAAAIFGVVQGCSYKSAGGPITWPGRRELPQGQVRGHCRIEGCQKEVAPSGWAKRMRLCARCFVLEGGKKCGRPRTGVTKTITCRVCRKKFQYYVKPNYRPRTCSHVCGWKFAGQNKVKRPKSLTKDALYELYWGRNMTAPEIVVALSLKVHQTVIIQWLKKDGTPRRVSNWRTYTHCVIEGCGAPRFALKQQDGRPYGRLCHTHYCEREARNARIKKKEMIERNGGELVRIIGSLLAGLPDSVKQDAESEIVLAVLSGDLLPPITGVMVKPFITKAFSEYADQYGSLSLDMPAPGSDGDDGYTWGQRLGLS